MAHLKRHQKDQKYEDDSSIYEPNSETESGEEEEAMKELTKNSKRARKRKKAKAKEESESDSVYSEDESESDDDWLEAQVSLLHRISSPKQASSYFALSSPFWPILSISSQYWPTIPNIGQNSHKLTLLSPKFNFFNFFELTKI